MRISNFTIGKIVLMFCNFFFLISGVALIALGALLLTDVPRVLLSRLLSSSEGPPHPLFYYVALGFIVLGIVVCATGVLGWWAACLKNHYILGCYLFLLILLLLGECTFSAVATICPQYFGVGVSADRLIDTLHKTYGVPGKDQYTAAIDLAQTMFQCCGINSASDYNASWWRLKDLGQRELLVPRSCCVQLNSTSGSKSFLDPQPLNATLCQSKEEIAFSVGRHIEGCVTKIETWLRHHTTIFLGIGSGIVFVELSVLLGAILVCLHVPRYYHHHSKGDHHSL